MIIPAFIEVKGPLDENSKEELAQQFELMAVHLRSKRVEPISGTVETKAKTSSLRVRFTPSKEEEKILVP